MKKKKITALLSALMLSVSMLPCHHVFAENDDNQSVVKGIKPIGTFDEELSFSNNYPFTLDMISETAVAETAECIIDGNYTADTVDRSCSIKELTHDLIIDAGDNDIIVLPDDLELNNTITVKADSGRDNADVTGENDGVTNADALAIQMHLLKLA